MATFYRIVKTNPPKEADFLSYRALGRSLLRDTPSQHRSWEGISVTSTLGAARALSARAPNLGRFSAVLELAEHSPVRFEQTGRTPEHYDLWGEPRDVMMAVIQVVPA